MATTTTKNAEVEEAVVRVLEELSERVRRLEIAVGTVAALLEGASTSDRVAARMPELAELLRRHEVSGRHPQWHGGDR
jgi:hypothetical protein